jgi:hypothetical protein
MDELKDDDLFLVNREGIDYKVSFADLLEALGKEPEVPIPWEEKNKPKFS